MSFIDQRCTTDKKEMKLRQRSLPPLSVGESGRARIVKIRVKGLNATAAAALTVAAVGAAILPYRYCGFVCVYVCAIIMFRFKVAMCRFIIFRQEHTDIKTYGHAVRAVRIALGETGSGDNIGGGGSTSLESVEPARKCITSESQSERAPLFLLLDCWSRFWSTGVVG